MTTYIIGLILLIITIIFVMINIPDSGPPTTVGNLIERWKFYALFLLMFLSALLIIRGQYIKQSIDNQNEQYSKKDFRIETTINTKTINGLITETDTLIRIVPKEKNKRSGK